MRTRLFVLVAALAACNEPPIELTPARSQLLLVDQRSGSDALDFQISVPAASELLIADGEDAIWRSKANDLEVWIRLAPEGDDAPSFEAPCATRAPPEPIVVERRATPHGVQVTCKHELPRGETIDYYVTRLERDGDVTITCDVSLGRDPSARKREAAEAACASLRIIGRSTWILAVSPLTSGPTRRDRAWRSRQLRP